MAVRSSGASTQPRALEERAQAVESCRIQKWLVPSLESHGKTKSPEKTGKNRHGDVEDITSTDCIAAKDEEGRGGCLSSTPDTDTSVGKSSHTTR